MTVSLQTKLLLAVGLLAIAAVVAVALSARQTTRMEFRRFQEHEEERSSMVRSRDAEEIASRLIGRCRDADALGEATAFLKNREVALLVGDDGRLIATGGPGTADLRDVKVRQSGDALTVAAFATHIAAAEDAAARSRGASRAAWARTSASDPENPSVRSAGTNGRSCGGRIACGQPRAASAHIFARPCSAASRGFDTSRALRVAARLPSARPA